jgi:hypothetical protein
VRANPPFQQIAAPVNLSELFENDAEAAVLHVLREASDALSAVEIKRRLQAGGVPKAAVDWTWPRVQKKIRYRDRIVVEGGRHYRWTDGAAGGSAPSAPSDLATERDAAVQRATIPLLRALADLAIEVEELTTNGASARAMIHRVRAQVKRVGLEPIEGAGERATLDRTRHEPIGDPIDDGTPVVVVRPGYIWNSPHGDVLIARAVVQDRG